MLIVKLRTKAPCLHKERVGDGTIFLYILAQQITVDNVNSDRSHRTV